MPSAMLLVIVIASLVMPVAPAVASDNVTVSGPSEFNNWLYQEGRVGATITIDIRDPRHKLRIVEYCFNRGGTPNCTTLPLRNTGWKTPSGWRGTEIFLGARMPTQGCYYMEQSKPKVDFVVRVYDGQGKKAGRGHLLMTDVCVA